MSEQEMDMDLGTYNLSGVKPYEGGGPQIPHKMPVIGKVVKFSPKVKEDDVVPDGQGGTTNAISAMVEVEVHTPPEFAGARRSFFLRFAPFDDSDNGKRDHRRIVTTLVSGGYDEASVAADGVQMTAKMFRDITDLHVENEHVVKDGKRDYDQIQVITKPAYDEAVSRIAANGLPDQTPRQVQSRKAREEGASSGAGGGVGASSGKGAAESGGPGKLTKGPAKGAVGGGKALGLRSTLTKAG